MITADEITGLILAGGLGRRMGADGRGADKALVSLGGRAMIDHVIERISPQVSTLLINANQDPARFAPRPWPVVPDRLPGHAGPLAGLHAGLALAATDWVLMVPCDSPFLPLDLARQLADAAGRQAVPIAVAAAGGREQPVFALVARKLCPDLQDYLQAGGRKIDHWYHGHPYAVVQFDDQQAFVNLNTREDIDRHGGS
ncbi:MAG: molybdenum cofactor guanylyltransferase MobA [Burkholderiaceae bacterium]